MRPWLCVLAVVVGCGAKATAATAPPVTPAPRPVDGAVVESGRAGVDPPRYKPSSRSAEAIPITDDAYGAFPWAEAAPHLGDTFPDFELPLADGGTYRLSETRRAGPVLVMFYRGFW